MRRYCLSLLQALAFGSVVEVCLLQLAFATACGFIWFSSRVEEPKVSVCLITVMPLVIAMSLLHSLK